MNSTSRSEQRRSRRRSVATLAGALAVVAALSLVLASATDLGDDAARTAPWGPGAVNCDLPRAGYVTCQRQVDVGDSQRLEVAVADGEPAVVVRASADGGNHRAGRRVEPGTSRILVNAGYEGTYRIQARTRMLDMTSATARFDVVVVDQ
jgi:hypothetical protein